MGGVDGLAPRRGDRRDGAEESPASVLRLSVTGTVMMRTHRRSFDIDGAPLP